MEEGVWSPLPMMRIGEEFVSWLVRHAAVVDIDEGFLSPGHGARDVVRVGSADSDTLPRCRDQY